MNEPKLHEYDPNYSTSVALVEIRRILSQSRTSLEILDSNPSFITRERTYGRDADQGESMPHPDLEEMKDVLRKTVAGLAQWERRGTRRGA